MSVHNPTNQGRSDDDLRLTARLMMLMVDSNKSWGEPGHEGVDGDKQVIGVMDAAAIAAAAVAEPSFLPWLLTQAGYEKRTDRCPVDERDGTQSERDILTGPWG